MASLYDRIMIGAKTLFSGRGGGGSTYAIRSMPAPTARFNWSHEAGDLRMNPIVAICLDWAVRNINAVPIKLYGKTRLGEEYEIEGHPLLDLIQQANPLYDGEDLIGAMAIDLFTTGGAFAYINKTGRGQPGELYWMDGRYVAPDFPPDGSNYLNYWKYTPATTGRTNQLKPDEVFVVRKGIDPLNDRLGLSPLQAQIRAVAIINLLENYTGGVLKNVGSTNIVITPMGENSYSPEQAQDIRISTQQRISGDMAGSPLVFNMPTNVSALGAMPKDLLLGEQDATAVSRICGAFGQSPMLHGLPDPGKTYSNLRECQRAAWNNGIIPIHRLIEKSINRQLVPAFGLRGKFRVCYDYTSIEALAEDRNEIAKTVALLFEKGLITRNEGREAAGYEPTPDGDIYSNELQNTTGGQFGDPEAVPVGKPEDSTEGEDETADEEDNEDSESEEPARRL